MTASVLTRTPVESSGRRDEIARPRILVVDDEPSMREMLRIVLRREGYDVMVAEIRGGETVRSWIWQPQHRVAYVAERGVPKRGVRDIRAVGVRTVRDLFERVFARQPPASSLCRVATSPRRRSSPGRGAKRASTAGPPATSAS